MAVDKIESETGADKARAIAERLPRLVRFAVVGGVGLLGRARDRGVGDLFRQTGAHLGFCDFR